MEKTGFSSRVATQPQEANNLANSLLVLKRHTEAKALARKILPVAGRVLGECNEFTLMVRMNYALALYRDDGATLDDHREAVTTIRETEVIARRVLGGAHPLTMEIKKSLRGSRAALAARETPSS